MEVKINSGTEGELRLKRKGGRPLKGSNDIRANLVFREETCKAFYEAKRQYRESSGIPYDLTNVQFMAVLIQNLQQRQ